MFKSKKITLLFAAFLVLALTVVPAMAQRPIAPKATGGAFKIGTLGAGLEYGREMNSKTTIKFNVNAFNYDYDDTDSGIDYDYELKLMTVGVLVDYHPSLDNNFRITGGFFYNGNEVEANGKTTTNATIGGTNYTAAQIGTVNSNIDFDDFAPYIGIGWGKIVDSSRNGRFTFDLGVMFQGSLDVTLTSTSALVTAADLRLEETQLESDLDDFEYYPVVSIGYVFNF